MDQTHVEQQHVWGHYRYYRDGIVEQGGFENSVPTVDLMCVDERETMRDMDDSQLVGAPEAGFAPKEDVSVAEVEMLMMMTKKMEVKPVETMVAKRKRGRPPGGLAKTNKTTPLVRKNKDEEDVCFICFDGGSLVLCDRRGCPKAYHPACIKRDESFFKSKAKWNCDWHICSSCQKAARYMCYTCTYSLCKACIKDADYLSVRENNGFCGMCMRTVLLIENFQGNAEVARVDFDDKSSWEYLFKMYWIFLKGKLSLTLDELTRAKNPWKGAYSIAYKGKSSGELHDGIDDKVSSFDNSCAGLQTNNSKKRKVKKQPIFSKDFLTKEKTGSDKDLHLPEGTIWASKELLEFVAHMKNGDTSVLSQLDVQALLLEYVRKNNLRDPRRKCQIVCDLRLISLFGKAHIGHFEMLKLLESHFLIKECSSAHDRLRVGVFNDISGQVEADGYYDNQLPIGCDKGHKKHKKADDRGSQTNSDAFASINVHNINLIYLTRNLMETLMDDADKFHEKVVGSIVRIRIPNSDKKQETYRLVLVAGTSKVAKPYKRERNTDVMLEILNLDKKEVISIDGISNQNFCEDECKRLRQSIKFGLIKWLTVGEIQAKAMTLQAVRVNDVLEAEII